MSGAKSDMERIGLFSEVGYITVGDRYTKVHEKPFNGAAYKGKQIIPTGSKTRSALQAGYFESSFKRIMEKEAYSDPMKQRRQQRLKESEKNISKAFLPNSCTKRPCGLGSHYGTFSGPLNAFSPSTRNAKEYVTPGKNFVTTPTKKGTGYGYVGVTLGKYQNHASEPYDVMKEMRKKDIEAHKEKLQGPAFRLNTHPQAYFDRNPYKSDQPTAPVKTPPKLPTMKPFKPSTPARKLGGAKAGTFDPYPSHSNDPYTVKKEKQMRTNPMGRIFNPAVSSKSRPTRSIVTLNVLKAVHRHNYDYIKRVTTY